MKSLTAVVVLVASATVANAQVIVNPNNTFTCPVADGSYCIGGSLSSNIIIRCTGNVGKPGNCNDNLAGAFPPGLAYSPCWEPDASSAHAACSKNCVVYGGSGNYNGTFTLTNCTPTATQSSTTVASTTTTVLTNPTTTPLPTTTTTVVSTPIGTISIPIGTGTGSSGPSGTGNPTGIYPTSSGGGGGSPTGTQTGGGSATASPIGPTTTGTGGPATYTGAAATHPAGAILAAAGLLGAYLL